MLNVYRASAGSGKTFKLTYEYIKMLLGRRKETDEGYQFYKNYNNTHRRILAVTFTNKATAEMKQRIVKQLEVLAYRPSESKYCKDLCRAFDCDVIKLQSHATQVLQQLLHDFSYFNISTIDSFFQQVLRAFVREVGLQGGYEVEMDSSYVATAAIDSMFGELEDNPEVLEWLMQYADENIRQDGKWNIFDGSDITTLAKELEKEEYKKFRSKLQEHNLQSYREYIKALQAHRIAVRDQVIAASQDVIKAIAQLELTKELFQRGWIVCFDKLANVQSYETAKELKAAIDTFNRYFISDKWLNSSKLKKHPIGEDGLIHALRPVFTQFAERLDSLMVEYNSVPVCLKHIYALGVLSTIDEYVTRYESENNSLLLSRTPDILKGLINESDAPFIYEKVGTRIAHYMIDEFQDTSNFQWDNFEPLVNESLAWKNENLIVGDVKQSIYRWRNSDWRLLHEELEKYNYHSVNDGRDTNWRSCANVVKFNNTFFMGAARLLQDQLEKEYKMANVKGKKPELEKIFAEVAQNVSPDYVDKPGRVMMQVLHVNNKDVYNEHILKQLPNLLKELFDKGYRQRDIAFLVRFHDEGRSIVEMLLNLAVEGVSSLHDIRVVSDESLLISKAPPVQLIVGILRYLQNPSYPINELVLSYEYGLINTDGDVDREELVSNVMMQYFGRRGSEDAIEPALRDFINEIASKPLFEMCECIIDKFRLNNNSAYVAYIEAFQDRVVEFCQTHTADLYSFLRWWGEREAKAAVKLPENLDAITVMTIHSSKGLEFPVVIVPYATWTLSANRRNPSHLKWFVPDRPPYNRLPVLPVDYTTTLPNTIFATQYYAEFMNEYVDCLNTLYVAFTRAKQELIACTFVKPKGDSNSVGNLINDVLGMPLIDREEEGVIDLSTTKRTEQWTYEEDSALEEIEVDIYEVGADWIPIAETKPEVQMLDVTYNVVVPDSTRLKQRITSRNKSGNEKQNHGIFMHEILAEIVCAADVHDVVQRYEREGKLKGSNSADMEREIVRLISLPQTSRWFNPEVTVVTETSILKWGEKINRPDRVVIDGNRVTVIDYKFGALEREEYKEKVSEYMQLVRDMGYTHVEGCIWYVEKEKFVAVE